MPAYTTPRYREIKEKKKMSSQEPPASHREVVAKTLGTVGAIVGLLAFAFGSILEYTWVAQSTHGKVPMTILGTATSVFLTMLNVVLDVGAIALFVMVLGTIWNWDW